MYLMEIDGENGSRLVQGFVRSRWPLDVGASGSAEAWGRLFLGSIGLWSQLRPLSIGVRLELFPGRPISTVHSFVVPDVGAQRLRIALAAFLRADHIGEARALVPYDEADLAGSFVQAAQARFGLKKEVMRTGQGVAILHNVRLADRLPALLEAAAGIGVPLTYEANVASWAVPREIVRDVLYNAANLAGTASTPAGLVRDQATLADRVKRAAFHIEECVGSAAEGDADGVSAILADVLRQTIYGSFGAEPQVVPATDAQQEAFAYHVHSHVMGEEWSMGAEEASSAADHAEVQDLLSLASLGLGATIRSSPLLLPSLQLGVGSGARGGEARSVVPATGREGPSFLFVSYARENKDLVYPLVDEIAKSDIALWIDRGILAGDEWLAELEERLLQCAGIVAFLSVPFAVSRYCRREVTFADAIKKPIIPVELEPTDLTGGLQFLLHGVQRISIGRDRQLSGILDAIKKQVSNTGRPSMPAQGDVGSAR